MSDSIHYGYCPFCAAEIERPRGTRGRAPSTCGAAECVRKRDAEKQAAHRAGKSHRTDPLGGFGDFEAISHGTTTGRAVMADEFEWEPENEGIVALDGFAFADRREDRVARKDDPASKFVQGLGGQIDQAVVNGETGIASKNADAPFVGLVWSVGARELERRRSGVVGDDRPWRGLWVPDVSPKFRVSEGDGTPLQGLSPLFRVSEGDDAPANLDADVWASLTKEHRMLNPANLAAVVAAVDPESGEVHDVALDVVSVTITTDGRPDRVWAKVGDGKAIDITDAAWRWLLVDMTMPEDELLAVLTRWHYEIQLEADTARGASRDWLEDLGLAV